MAPKKYVPKLNADSFEAQYGILVRSEYPDLTSARQIKTALVRRMPPIEVSEGVLKVWLHKTGIPDGAVVLKSAADLQTRYGDLVIRLFFEHRSAYLLCKALRAQQPPLYVTEDACKYWLRRYAPGLEVVRSARQLELRFGDVLRTRASGLSHRDLRVCRSSPGTLTWQQTISFHGFMGLLPRHPSFFSSVACRSSLSLLSHLSFLGLYPVSRPSSSHLSNIHEKTNSCL